MVWQPEIDQITKRRELARQMGGAERVQDQHDRGRLTVRERIDLLTDEGSFRERGILAGTGYYDNGELSGVHPAATVIGVARIHTRPVAVVGSDFTARPRSGSEADQDRAAIHSGGDKSRHIDAIAQELKIPLIRLVDSFGGDIRATTEMGRTYLPELHWGARWTKLLAEVPVVSAALGSVAGLPAAEVPASHFSVMVRGNTQVFAGGPPLVERSLGDKIDKEALGGYKVHARGSGVVDNDAEDEADAFRQIRAFLSYLPSNVHQLPPVHSTNDPANRREEALASIIPRQRKRGYDARSLIALVVDQDSFFELGRYFGRAQITAFARIDGMPVGVLANDPMHYGGAMGAKEARKFERFVDLCDVFHLPIINFADQPGFVVGRAGESDGTLRAGVRVGCAIAECQVPWATVVVRRLYGVAGATHQDFSRFCFRIAWPSAEWGSLPIEGGVAAAYRREIEAAPDPDTRRTEIEERLIGLRNPFSTAEDFAIEDIVDPRDTRPMLAEWLQIAYEQQIPSQLGIRIRYGMRP
jgi:acetyl-CoA carboxylase carboxyltransferase component